jgi:hypothetical protein
MFKWFTRDDDYDYKEDRFTLKDFLKSLVIFVVALFVINGFTLIKDKISCAYTGYTYEKNTKRPIFSECLIQMKDGSYVPLERYINRVLTFNDLGNGVEQ